MNSDIRIDIEFWNHAKTQRMMRELGPLGPISLQRLWCYAAKHRPTGVLDGMDADDIEHAAGWTTRQKGKFFDFCLRNRWLDVTEIEGQFKIHEWARYNSWAAEAPSRREYSQKGAHVKYHEKRGISKPNVCKFCAESDRVGKGYASGGDRYPSAPAPAPAPCPAPAPPPSPSPAPIAHTRAREVADAWNAMAAVGALGDKVGAVSEATADAQAGPAEKATAEILKLRPDFTWLDCIARIDKTSWLVTTSQAFSFEWLFKRDQHKSEWNAVKIWDRRLGAPDKASQSPFDDDGRLKDMVL